MGLYSGAPGGGSGAERILPCLIVVVRLVVIAGEGWRGGVLSADAARHGGQVLDASGLANRLRVRCVLLWGTVRTAGKEQP
jgi:hypothetical protein